MESFAPNEALSSWLVSEEADFSDKDISSDVEAELYSHIYYNEDCDLSGGVKKDSNVCDNLEIVHQEFNEFYCGPMEYNQKEISNIQQSGHLDKRPSEWVILGKISDTSNVLHTKSGNSCFALGKFPKNDKYIKNLSTATSSECEIVLEVHRGPSKNKSDSSVVMISESSDDDLKLCSVDETSSVNENFTLNIINSSVAKSYQNAQKTMPVQLGNDPVAISKSPNLKLTNSVPLNKSIDRVSAMLTTQSVDRQNYTNFTDTTESISKNLWSLNNRDKFKTSFQETTFYKEKSKLNKVRCHNCKECGHLSKHCTKPKRFDSCFLCGQEGHNGEFCPNPVCPQCQRVGHTVRFCLWGSDDLKYHCSICKTPGHLREECTDMWRRYYLTTGIEINSEAWPTKHLKPQSCCNCGKKGHTSNICQSKTMDSYILPSLKVHSFSDPEDYINSFNKKVLKKGDKTIASLFNKKSYLAKLANEKYRKTVCCNYSSKRTRTYSSIPFTQEKHPPLRKDLNHKFRKRYAPVKIRLSTLKDKKRPSQKKSEINLNVSNRQRKKLKQRNSKNKKSQS